MSAEATLEKDADTVDVTADAARASGEVLQLTDGRASVVSGLKAVASGDPMSLRTCGQERMPKASVVCLKGAQAFWDRTNNVVTPLQGVTGANYKCGVFLEDASATAADVLVDMNASPVYLIQLQRDPFEHLLVKTVVGSTTVLMPILEVYGGVSRLAFGLTAEAQKLDLLSKNTCPKTVPFIVEGRCAIYDIGDAAALDFNIGLANATHASDADAITESLFLHFDGTALDIKAESDDGTTEVAATDTTVDAVDDTYFDFAFDCRDLAAIKIYINGVRVLSATAFKLDAATGPFKLLAHLEKSADDTPGDVRIANFTLRTFDVK